MKKTVYKKGHTIVTLMVFVVIGLAIASAAIVMVLVNSRNASSFEQGAIAHSIAEAGVENAILRLLRNPGYTGETMTVGDGTATVEVVTTGVNQSTITSVGVLGSFRRTLEVQVTVNALLSVDSWRETY